MILMATPHKARLTAWQRIYLHISRHLARKLLAGRQPSGVIFIQSDEKSDCVSAPPALCGIALFQYKRHDHGQYSSNERIADQRERPFADQGFPVDVGHQVFCTRNDPCFCLSDPVPVNEQPVEKSFHQQNNADLPETVPEYVC